MIRAAVDELGYVPQSEDVDWQFPVTVRDVVMMGRYGHMGFTRHARAEDIAAVDRALERTHLESFADRQIGQLSGGQKKRAFIARGIAQGASIMLLDEPFAGVDKHSEATITELLRDLAAEGTTIFVVTHDLDLVAGWRVNRQDSGSKRWASRWANRIRARMLRDNTPDTGCGIKLFELDKKTGKLLHPKEKRFSIARRSSASMRRRSAPSRRGASQKVRDRSEALP